MDSTLLDMALVLDMVLGTDRDIHHSLEMPTLLLPIPQLTLPQTELHHILHNHIHDSDHDARHDVRHGARHDARHGDRRDAPHDDLHDAHRDVRRDAHRTYLHSSYYSSPCENLSFYCMQDRCPREWAPAAFLP
jgi:hypothetical protein